ncbi:MAG: hypothetical protein JJE04_09005 [Acidobacteriia bacterium]|nr:hypothetical protein [Terriglobia bacterium]
MLPVDTPTAPDPKICPVRTDVVDASIFISSTAVNPALTIMANALRVGDHPPERNAVKCGRMIESCG